MATAGRYDVVFLDHDLSVMNGSLAARALKESGYEGVDGQRE